MEEAYNDTSRFLSELVEYRGSDEVVSLKGVVS